MVKGRGAAAAENIKRKGKSESVMRKCKLEIMPFDKYLMEYGRNL